MRSRIYHVNSKLPRSNYRLNVVHSAGPLFNSFGNERTNSYCDPLMGEPLFTRTHENSVFCGTNRFTDSFLTEALAGEKKQILDYDSKYGKSQPGNKIRR